MRTDRRGRLVPFHYNLRTASEYELEIAEYLIESGLGIREEEGHNGARTIWHHVTTPEDHDEFDRLYHRGAYR